MAEAVVVKTIKPSKLKVDALRLQLLNAMRAQGTAMKMDFEATVKTWKNKPKFKVVIGLKKAIGPEVLVGTDDEIYGYVNDGTEEHDIWAGFYTGKSTKKVLSFQWGGKGSYRPKTTPRVIGSKAGGPTGPRVARPYVRHPGTKARHFDEEIEKKQRPRFKRRMEKAMSEAAKASGHSI